MAEFDVSEDASDQVDGRRNSRRICTPCDNKMVNTTADLYCKNCAEFLCVECSKIHDTFSFAKGHEKVKATVWQQPKAKFDLKGLNTCHDHTKKFEFYCADDDILCCSSCAVAMHRTCKNINELAHVFVKTKPNITAVQSVLSELDTSAKKAVTVLQRTKDETANELEPVLEQIEQMKASVLKKFNDLKTSVADQINETKKKTNMEIDEKLSKTKTIMDKTKVSEDLLTSVFKHGSEEEKFITACVVRKQSTENLLLVRDLIKNTQRPVYSLKRDVLPKLLEPVNSQMLLHIDTIRVEPDIPVSLKLICSVPVRQVRGDGSVPLFTGMEFLPDGRLLVIDNSNKKLNIVNENLQKLGVHKFAKLIYDIAVISNEQVAVTTGEFFSIEFLLVSSANEVTVIRRLKTTAPYYSICLMNDSTFLVGTFNHNHPMRMLNLTGEEKDFINLPAKRYDIDDSRSTCNGNKHMLFLTDKNDNSVHLYKSDRNTISSKLVLKLDKLREPMGVCVGPDDSLFICSAETDSIVQVSTSGKVVSSHKLDMEFPRTLCLSKDGKTLAVANDVSRTRKLQIFHVHF